EPPGPQRPLAEQPHHAAHGGADDDGSPPHGRAHGVEVLDHGLGGVVAVGSPVGFTVAAEVQRPGLVSPGRQPVGRAGPAVAGLAAAVEQQHRWPVAGDTEALGGQYDAGRRGYAEQLAARGAHRWVPTFSSENGTALSTRGSPGRPSTRSPMMLRWIWSDPPAME